MLVKSDNTRNDGLNLDNLFLYLLDKARLSHVIVCNRFPATSTPFRPIHAVLKSVRRKSSRYQRGRNLQTKAGLKSVYSLVSFSDIPQCPRSINHTTSFTDSYPRLSLVPVHPRPENKISLKKHGEKPKKAVMHFY